MSVTRGVLPLALVQLRGSQVAMGRQHGEVLREIGGWQPAMDYYPRMIEGLLRGSGTDPLTRALPTASRPLLEMALSRLQAVRPEPYLARSRAFAATVGRDASQARYLQVMDVFQNVIGTVGRLGLGPFAEQAAARMSPACSTLAVWGEASANGRLTHARNFDFPGAGIWDRAPAVVFCTPDEGLRYGFVTTRGADVPGITAFNEAGICLTVHTRFHRQVRFDGAAIIDLGHDIARRATSLADAIDIARERRVASTWGLLVSSAKEGEAVLIEVNSNSVRTVSPGLDEAFLASTNHYRNPDQQRGELDLAPGWRMHTEGRLGTLERRARQGQMEGGLGIDQLKALLGSHDDPDLAGTQRAANGVLAQCTGVQSVVMDPEAAEIHVSVGRCPTGRGPWLAIPWQWSDSPGHRQVDPASATPHEGTSPRYADGPASEAWDSYMEASRLEALGDDPVAIRAAIELAARLDPSEPTWRPLQGGLHLQAGENAAALARFERGLEKERSPFYRGQLLLWAARAADACGRRRRATELRQELLSTTHRHLTRHHRAARREQARPCSRAGLRRTPVHVQLADIG